MSLWVSLPATTHATNEYFIVTAYYSPLPNQEYYITGNYEAEKRLNWNWIAWASWKNVFSGMLAAPGTYAFWTKIQLDGLGVWSVEDRWGAIVTAGNRWYSHDRIDVWMGYGDEWLRRAMYWGKRKVAWRVIARSKSTTLDYNTIPSPKWAVPKTTSLYWKTVTAFQNQPQEIDIFAQSLWKWSSKEHIEGLQWIFVELWYTPEESVTWIYDKETIDTVYAFQLERWIVTHEGSPWAWSYGPKTRASLKKSYTEFLEEKIREDEFFNAYQELSESSLEKARTHVDSIWKPLYWEISPSVRSMQKLFASLWYFKYKDTAIFWVKTKNTILEYQIEKKLISLSSDVWAWVFWPKTREAITLDLSHIYLLEMLEESELEDDYDTYILNLEDIIKSEENREISIYSNVLSI